MDRRRRRRRLQFEILIQMHLFLSYIYTQGRGLVIIGVASITVIRQDATLIVMTKMIRRTSCRTIGVAYSCILKA